ncbi:MAG: TonB-dependent receptor family protein [Janthinobacterium lividum]
MSLSSRVQAMRRRHLLLALLVPVPACVPSGPAMSQEAPERITVTGISKAPASVKPAGQTVYSTSRATYANTPALSVADMLVTVPGVSFVSGNGPRDVAISIRGSDDRQTYGLRNIQVLEDGFPMTQPDGLARADLIDPHAYAGADVVQGPASTVFGNYAVDGAILFRTRDGADLQGGELGSDFGSYGLFNRYVTAGVAGSGYDLMVFGSDVRGNGFIANSRYDTSTENVKLRIDLGPHDRLVFKVVNNVTDTRLPVRLSLDQYSLNPYQKGCFDLEAAGCGSVSLYRNGAYGPAQAVSPQAAGLGRFDRRTIVGARWEHDLDSRTTWRTQFAYDERDIDQPTSSTSYVGPYDSYNVSSDVTNNGRMFGLPVTSFVGANWNDLDFGSRVYNLTPLGGATLGSLSQTVYGHQWNGGARFQEEIRFASRWKGVVGLGGEYSDLGATETIFSYAATGSSRRLITGNRFYFNLAPEGALIYTPSADWTLHGRVGTGYGTPQTSNLFVTPQGLFGNNTRLNAQSNVGVDLGAEWHPSAGLTLQATGFYEFFRNELVSQTAGVNLQSYTSNAPASEHRGVELGADWTLLPRDLPGARLLLTYTYDNQIYTDYTEALANSAVSRSFDRSGNAIPGVVPNVLDVRLVYDRPSGRFEGIGGFLEFNFRDGFWLDNANLLKAPGIGLFNLDLHYDPPARLKLLHRFHTFFEIQNLADRSYVASASNLSDSLTSAGVQAGAAAIAARTGSIYAGARRSFFGGVRVQF